MNKKPSVKTFIIIGILILFGVLGVFGMDTARTFLSGASADTMAKNVLSKPSEDGKSAVITWSSDKETQGVVEYGTSPASLLLRAPEAAATTNHSVNLSPLKANTKYHFRIKVGEEIYDDNGIPFTFSTKGSAVATQVLPSPTGSAAVTPAPTVGSICDSNVDNNKDGVVNSLDRIYCLKLSPTLVATSPTPGKCEKVTDLNGDGVVNSLDRMKCLQAK